MIASAVNPKPPVGQWLLAFALCSVARLCDTATACRKVRAVGAAWLRMKGEGGGPAAHLPFPSSGRPRRPRGTGHGLGQPSVRIWPVPYLSSLLYTIQAFCTRPLATVTVGAHQAAGRAVDSVDLQLRYILPPAPVGWPPALPGACPVPSAWALAGAQSHPPLPLPNLCPSSMKDSGGAPRPPRGRRPNN